MMRDGIEAGTGETRSGSIREADESPVTQSGTRPNTIAHLSTTGADERAREALEAIAKLERSIMADVSTAHSLRGEGASSEMRSDDRDMRAALRHAFGLIQAALTLPVPSGDGVHPAPDVREALIAELENEVSDARWSVHHRLGVGKALDIVKRHFSALSTPTQALDAKGEAVAYAKRWWRDGRPRFRVDLTEINEPWLEALNPTVTPLFEHCATPVTRSAVLTEAKRAADFAITATIEMIAAATGKLFALAWEARQEIVERASTSSLITNDAGGAE